MDGREGLGEVRELDERVKDTGVCDGDLLLLRRGTPLSPDEFELAVRVYNPTSDSLATPRAELLRTRSLFSRLGTNKTVEARSWP